MTISERIAMLRKERGLTLEEVGNRVGVGKSTVRKWESGLIANMRRDKIAKLANALSVDPAFLMGWQDEQKTETDSTLAPSERQLVERYRELNAEGRARLLDEADLLASSYRYQKDSAPAASSADAG